MALAPPASRAGWSFAAGDLYVEASGHNRHRRATAAELAAHFDGGEDRPAHWYEAQLLHYGLPPSRAKGTAKMRLLDAVRRGDLAVPDQVRRTEADLRKEWARADREAKQALKGTAAAAAGSTSTLAKIKNTPTTTATTTKAAAGTKRKAEEALVSLSSSINLTISVSLGANGTAAVQTASVPEPAAKKAKTVKTTKAAPPPKIAKEPAAKSAPKKEPAAAKAKKATVGASGAPAKAKNKSPLKKPPMTTTGATKKTGSATAKKKQPATATASSTSVTAATTLEAAPTRAPRTKTTARRGGSMAAFSSRPPPSVPALPPQGWRVGGFPGSGLAMPVQQQPFSYITGDNDDDGGGYDEPPPPDPGSPMDIDDQDDDFPHFA